MTAAPKDVNKNKATKRWRQKIDKEERFEQKGSSTEVSTNKEWGKENINRRGNKRGENKKIRTSAHSVVGSTQIRDQETQVRTPRIKGNFIKNNDLFLEQQNGTIHERRKNVNQKMEKNEGKFKNNSKNWNPRARSPNQIWKIIKNAKPEEPPVLCVDTTASSSFGST
eukprot:TRINITY_DN6273_c0_g1_i3.p1 TRINITY_DN6273_c0_g1~~TRINITY_DN6273_c0_g1_i3.p1  ORF type:complete len:168 (-),score=18.50 TRINITY_DN6273_c0_g1_i3:12-515(-)